DDEKTDQDVDSGDDVDHKFNVFLSSMANRPEARFARISGGKCMVRKGGFEPPRLSAPPPQDGVSASSTTSALLVFNNVGSFVEEGISHCTRFCNTPTGSTSGAGRSSPPNRTNNFRTASSCGWT